MKRHTYTQQEVESLRLTIQEKINEGTKRVTQQNVLMTLKQDLTTLLTQGWTLGEVIHLCAMKDFKVSEATLGKALR